MKNIIIILEFPPLGGKIGRGRPRRHDFFSVIVFVVLGLLLLTNINLNDAERVRLLSGKL